MAFTKATTKSVYYRFWSKVDKQDDGECWPWRGSLSGGYGHIRIGGHRPAVSRFSFALHKGDIPTGQEVRHTCDNPACVNPDHLILGTHADNMRDRSERGRSGRCPGENNGRAKLTAENIQSIRGRLESGETVASLAREFDVSWTAIKYIKTGRNWSKVGAQ